MKRRAFISSVAAGGVALSVPGIKGEISDASGSAGAQSMAVPEKPAGQESPISRPSFRLDLNSSLPKIGPWSLEELRGRFQKELEEDTIGFWGTYGIDREYGAYLTPDKKDKTYRNTDKDLYSQGRVLWLFSYLYNNFGKNDKHLEAARQGYDALLKNCRLAGGHWGTLYTRDWKMKRGLFDIYADIYMVLGLQEYYKASADEEAKKLAVETAYAANEWALAPHYQGQGHGPFYEPGVKRLGTWVHFLFPLTLLLGHIPEDGLERIARFCVRNILTHHWQKDTGFAWECLDYQYAPYSEDYLSRWVKDFDWAHQISGWHSVQGAYKIMLEAVRVGSRPMFLDGLEFGLQTMKTHWTDQGQGGFQGFDNVSDLKRGAGKAEPDAAIYDYLVFSLLAIEHTHSPEAVGWFEKIYAAVLKRPEGIFTGSLTLHEPRGVMFCLGILDRMIRRGAKTSDFFRAG